MPAVMCIKILRTFSSAVQMLLCYKCDVYRMCCEGWKTQCFHYVIVALVSRSCFPASIAKHLIMKHPGSVFEDDRLPVIKMSMVIQNISLCFLETFSIGIATATHNTTSQF